MPGRNQFTEIKEDTSTPIEVLPIIDSSARPEREAADAYNRYVLTEREVHGRRTRIKVSFECWARNKRYTAYMRLRRKHLVLSLPSSDQAELAIDLIRRIVQSLDGKLLAPADSGTSPRG